MKTGLIYHKNCVRHKQLPGHPEISERVSETMKYFKETGLIKKVKLFTPKEASESEILMVHEKQHFEHIKNLSEGGGGPIDGDTYVGPETFNTALLAVGGVIHAGSTVMEGGVDNSFALVRPPGHHASPNKAAGFCYFNNVAIMIKYVQSKYKLKRVFLFDWDAHAFDGTMEIFYNDNSVLNVSVHQDPHFFYPGIGFMEQTGEGSGRGYTVNIPVPAGTGDVDYIYILENFLIPRVREYKPELIVISAGQDSHADDPLSGLCLTERGYAKMTKLLMKLAGDFCKGRLVVELEGGYNLGALKKSSYCIVSTLLGEPTKEIKGQIRDSTLNIVKELEEVLG